MTKFLLLFIVELDKGVMWFRGGGSSFRGKKKIEMDER